MRIELDFPAVLAQWPLLLHGLYWTVGLTAVATVLGMALGIAFAWARASGPAALRWVVGGYVELVRNTPFIVQLFFVFFGLPAAGVKLSPETASVIAMVSKGTMPSLQREPAKFGYAPRSWARSTDSSIAA